MAHNLSYYGSNQRAYMGRESAWHGLGKVTGEYFTWDDICREGMMAFEVEKRQLEFNGVPVEAWGTFRADNEAFLGAVGKDYTPIQHSAGFAGIDALIGSIDGAHYETAGVLGAGEVVWGMADLSLAYEVVPGDKHETYLLFSTSHDGTRSYEYRLTQTRVVCQNTLSAALNRKSESKLRVRHTKNAAGRIDDMHAVIADIRSQGEGVADTLRQLAQRKTTRETVTAVFDRLYPIKDGEESSSRRDNIIYDIMARFESNDRNAFPEVRGTAYNLLNAVTEYTDHYRSAQGGKRQESAMFGSGQALKSKALEVIVEVAGTMPAKATQTVYAMPAYTGGSVLDAILATA